MKIASECESNADRHAIILIDSIKRKLGVLWGKGGERGWEGEGVGSGAGHGIYSLPVRTTHSTQHF